MFFTTRGDQGVFDMLRRVSREMDTMFDDPWMTGIRSSGFGAFPPINVGATADRVGVYLFAPGLDPASLDISIHQNVLSIAGKRGDGAPEGATAYRQERFGGEFRRVVTLPEDVDADQVQATYRDGVLQVSVARKAAVRPRQITVN